MLGRTTKVVFVMATVFFASSVFGDCPTPPGVYSWSEAGILTVQYQFSQGVGGPAPDAYDPVPWSSLGNTTSNIISANNTWTYNNQTSNSTNVGFYNTTAGGPYNYYAYYVNYPGSFEDPGVAAQTAPSVIAGTNILVEADTTFWYGSLNPMNGALTMDPNGGQAYDDFISRATLHEIGHTMGLKDQPDHGGFCLGQIAGESVMNANCGTNDSAQNIATNITNCDNASVWLLFRSTFRGHALQEVVLQETRGGGIPPKQIPRDFTPLSVRGSH